VEHLWCRPRNIRLGYRTEWSIYGADPQTFDLATEKEWSTLQCRPTNIRLGYRTEWSILGADPKTLD